MGVDGSENSRQALRWAVDFAVPGDIVELVHVWSLVVAGMPEPGESARGPDAGAFETGVHSLLHDTADEVLEDEDRELLELRFTVVRGHAADVLLERAADADLLVVGRRGLGGFRALLVGSVCDDVVRGASCPVAVTPPFDRPRTATR